MKYLSGVSTLKFDSDKCTGCGRCMEVCPHAVFTDVSGEKKVRVLDPDLCMECGACVQNCAFGALDVDYGVGCAAAIINSMISGGPPSCDCSGDSGGSTGGLCC